MPKKKLTPAQKKAQAKKTGKKTVAKKKSSATGVKSKKKATAKKKTGKITNYSAKRRLGKYTGSTTIALDEVLIAKPRGKRVSKNGNVYYEYRLNMSDSKNKKDKYKGMV
tara:strand:+ start:22 stop:351 length:330 start_codon:yes stop_codon:yes gene_type:complete